MPYEEHSRNGIIVRLVTVILRIHMRREENEQHKAEQRHNAPRPTIHNRIVHGGSEQEKNVDCGAGIDTGNRHINGQTPKTFTAAWICYITIGIR